MGYVDSENWQLLVHGDITWQFQATPYWDRLALNILKNTVNKRVITGCL
jgi:hypothetical protein